MFKVLVSDSLSKESLDVFKNYKDIQVDVKTGLPPEELVKIIGEYDGLIVRSATKFKGELLEKASKMKVVGRAGAGVDNIDVENCSKKGIVVLNTPGGNSQAVAELTIGFIMALSRNIVRACMLMKDGKWEKKAFEKNSVEVGGKTLGLLGAGNIGSIVAGIAKGLKMDTIVYDPFLTDEKASIMGVKKANSYEEVYKSADYISLHVPKTPETVNLINKDSIAKMKNGVIIVNCARGGIVNEKDLTEALDSGKVAGAALDVFDKEPVEPDNPLVKHPSVICTPHLGASSVEAQVNVAIAIAYQVGDFLTKGEIRNAVNAPSLDVAARKILAPYLELSNKIGTLYRQYGNININEIEMLYEGEVYSYQVEAVTSSLLMGLLSGSMEGINFVNAQLAAKEKGIKIKETKKPEASDYASQITFTAKHKDGQTVIKGAVFKEGMIRIVEVDGFVLDFVPEGNLLLTLNKDLPGFIGEIGTVIGNAGLNISNMELGRNKNQGKALSFIQIDGEISDNTLEQVKKVKALEKVYRIKMS